MLDDSCWSSHQRVYVPWKNEAKLVFRLRLTFWDSEFQIGELSHSGEEDSVQGGIAHDVWPCTDGVMP